MIKFKHLLILTLAISAGLQVKGQDNKVALWKGFEKVQVNIDGHDAYYVKPTHPLPGNPWVWRASFPDWHTEIDSILLTKGFYVAFVNVDNQYGSPASLQVWDKFYTYLTGKLAFAPKVALEAVSRGGLYAYGWAKRNPDKVSCIYAETPVCDIKSWPGGKGKGPGDAAAWKELKQIYHFTEDQAIAYNDNPIDNLEGLASFRVPVLHTIGLNDKLAPPDENTYPFEKKYLALGGPMSINPITQGPMELQGHHFKIDRPDYYADFIINNSYPVKKVLPYSNYIKTGSKLNNFYYAAAVKKKATVSFLGGSITFNPGWRDKVCKYLKETYPETDFHFIAAGIPSLGSLPHAFRVQRDVLDSGKTDLLFVEAAVNDRGTDSTTQVRSLEGIVRHARNANPYTDIVFMAFVDPQKIENYSKGKVSPELVNHEMVAAHYNLPYINLALEVNDKIKNKELSWADDFKDIHPAHYGQELYFANIKSLLQTCVETTYKAPFKLTLPKPIDKARFENGSYYDLTNAKPGEGWQITPNWKPSDGLQVRDGFVNVPVLNATEPGSELSLPFKGNAVGIAVVAGGDAGTISYAVDKDEFKDLDLFTEFSSWLHLPIYHLLGDNLANGSHVLRIRISEQKNSASKGHACRIVHFFVNNK
ncbi:SGNH/GDSL hydrolase family protein [Mucilaginibacter sabulilitoris]|uniref:SGNH/GDSL hydrolase family protein n=1 Tax=Mucilaginibacter sabulilitoris TaxID=1173583 RepID=A0ABZ0TGF4_9SPHI|nr:SGNH/GDSL hydrolase family protein [Mucilaginibacter sabulilitoris]WPU92264.1 SGNH/GDSL hydrolase family protein [Mucilaginibacter sabulilitoris]